MLFVLCGSSLADRLSWANINFRWLLSHVKLMASMALNNKEISACVLRHEEILSDKSKLPVKYTTTSYSRWRSSLIPQVVVVVVIIIIIPIGIAQTVIQAGLSLPSSGINVQISE